MSTPPLYTTAHAIALGLVGRQLHHANWPSLPAVFDVRRAMPNAGAILLNGAESLFTGDRSDRVDVDLCRAYRAYADDWSAANPGLPVAVYQPVPLHRGGTTLERERIRKIRECGLSPLIAWQMYLPSAPDDSYTPAQVRDRMRLLRDLTAGEGRGVTLSPHYSDNGRHPAKPMPLAVFSEYLDVALAELPSGWAVYLWSGQGDVCRTLPNVAHAAVRCGADRTAIAARLATHADKAYAGQAMEAMGIPRREVVAWAAEGGRG